MEKILISACLLGQVVRYNAQPLPVAPLIGQWLDEGRLVSVCPEVSGGLATPRDPAERQGDNVVSVSGDDVSLAFLRGAQYALRLCQQQQIRFALFKARSPSCGNQEIYDGSFSGQLVSGQGVCAELLSQHGITVYNEQQLSLLQQKLG